MKKISKNLKIAACLLTAGIVIAGTPFVLYLNILPAAVSNPKIINFVEKTLQKKAGLNLCIKNPVLKTALSPDLSFKVDELSLTKDKTTLFSTKKFNAAISLEKIFDKKIIVKELGTDFIFADVNKLTELAKPTDKPAEKSDWYADFFDSILYLKKSEIIFKSEPNTFITLKADDIRIDNTQKEQRFIHFNIKTKIEKEKEVLNIAIADNNSVFIKDHKIWVRNCLLNINNSKIFLNAEGDKKNNFIFEVHSKKFNIPDIIELAQSNIIENNLSEPLSYFKNIKGDFDFNIKITNKDLNGKLTLNNLSFNAAFLSDLPVTVDKGTIDMTKDKITLNDFKGYYDNKQKNVIKFDGYVNDYLKSIDTNIQADALVTNDFSKKYLSKLVGCPIEMIGNAGTRITLKSINNKIDVMWIFRLLEGEDILVDGQSLSPSQFKRYLTADLHFEDILLNIKAIDYYIIPDEVKKIKHTPIITINGNVDFKDGLTNVKDIGFVIPKPLPSEILNIFAGPKFFRKGTIAGNLKINNTGKYPVLDGKMALENIRIPSQRLRIKSGTLTTENGLVKLASNGRFRRSGYDFSGDILNEIKFPVIIKDVNLTVDDVDVERFLALANNSPAQPVISEVPAKTDPANDDEDIDDNVQTFDIGNLIIENSELNITKGKYKDMNFGNVKAAMTLDKNSILKIHSNKFDIAEGISSAKVECDLKNFKYNIVLGIKEVDSDIIATSLLDLKKEISGKASGLITLSTDNSLKLNGGIKFIVKDGTIGKIGLVEYVLKFAALFRNPLAMVSPSTISDLVNIPDGRFEKITGNLEIKDNVIQKIQIKSSAQQLSAYIAGRFDLETRDATLRIYTKFSNKNKGVYGALRNVSLNSLANRMPLSSRNDSNFYSAELSELPEIQADEKDCQIFLTKVDGDVERNNFLSSLKKIK